MLKPAFQEACRAASRRSRARPPRRARRAGRPALGRGRQALQRLCAARRRRDRGGALQGRSAELRRLRREARVRAGPAAGADRLSAACASAFRSARTSGAATSVECLAETGAEILLVPNGSPYWRGKTDERLNIAVARVVESGLPLVYLNQVGGQDELVFDGASFVLNADRSLACQLPAFEEAVALTDWERGADGWRCVEGADRAWSRRATRPTTRACVLGLRDYVDKNRFPGVVLGLSGGIDSALCAAMAVDALGAERVHCVMLPYRYTSQRIARRRRGMRQGARRALRHRADRASRSRASRRRSQPLFAGRPRDITEENIQSRARGTILMAISNKFGAMVVTTGNKSEMSVGYATLYGDMNGGFNPIKDLYKTEVYRLSRAAQSLEAGRRARARTAWSSPRTSSPSRRRAELRENQKDQDSLPPYEVLDDILRRPGREARCASPRSSREGYDRETVQQGRAPALPRRIQAPPGGARREGRRARISAATAAIRSSTASAIRRRAPDDGLERPSEAAPGLDAPRAEAAKSATALALRHRACMPSPSSASPRRRPGTSISATPARRCSTRSSRAGKAAPSSCASTTRISRARRRNTRTAIEADLAWLGIPPDVDRAPVGAVRALRRGGRAAARRSAGSIPATRRRRSWNSAASASSPAACRRSTTARRSSSPTRSARRSRGEGRRPHWRFRLDPTTVAWDDLVRGDSHVDCSSLSDPVLVREDGDLSLHAALGGGRHRARHHPCDPRRGPRHQHGGADPDLRGARRGRSRLRAPQPADHGERRGAVEAPRPSLDQRPARGRARAAWRSPRWRCWSARPRPCGRWPTSTNSPRLIDFSPHLPRAGEVRRERARSSQRPPHPRDAL